MPSGKNWLNFLYVNLGFLLGVLSMYYFSSVTEIRDNWPEYRCNPMYMPLSTDLESDFTYCVQNMQKNMMGTLLQPITYVLSNIGSMSGDFMNSINAVRDMFNKIRSLFTSIIQNIFGVFLNIIIELQKLTIGIKDLVGKIVGIMMTCMYLIDGSVKTMNSAWNGPPGQMVRALGNCFHPDTKVKLENGTISCMKDLNLGDVLENGSKVHAIMKIDNTDKKIKEELYVIPGAGVDNEDIYVTGSHLVLNKNGKFIKVKKYINAKEQNDVKSDWYCCLITSDHIIQLGEETFWDWEDYIIKLSLNH